MLALLVKYIFLLWCTILFRDVLIHKLCRENGPSPIGFLPIVKVKKIVGFPSQKTVNKRKGLHILFYITDT